jgi:hypothetical protein
MINVLIAVLAFFVGLPGLLALIKLNPYAFLCMVLFAVACTAVVGLLSALQYKGEPLTKNEPFRWATAYPRIKKHV